MVLASVGPGGVVRAVGCSGVSALEGRSSLQPPVLQLWMVMGLGMCMHSMGLRGCGCEGPMQDTALDWIPYPQETEHWKGLFFSFQINQKYKT